MTSFVARLIFALLVALPAAAQRWTGGGPDNNWSTGANWSGGVAPASSAATQVTFPGGSSPSVVDMPWTVNRITFEANFTLSGQAITLAGAAPAIESVHSSIVHNPITLTGTTTAFSLFPLSLAGAINGTGPLVLNSVGGISLNGANTYTGGTSIVSGGVGLFGSMLGPVTVGDGASSLRGFNGTVSGPVVVNAGGTTEGVIDTGNLAVAGFVSLFINGPAQGAQYDRINVTGSVTLTNARLGLSGSYVPVAGDVFTIIPNDGADAVSGTFAGLPEGRVIVLNGVPLTISYVGGTGNDVTLSAAGLFGGVRAVPTLSQWALILMAALALVIGMHRLRSGD